MRRLNVLLRKFEEGRAVQLLNSDTASSRREKVIAEMQNPLRPPGRRAERRRVNRQARSVPAAAVVDELCRPRA
jgi:hypothetical protein